MSAYNEVKRMLKEIYDEGDVNAMGIWKGYDAVGRFGWCYKRFGDSGVVHMGKSVVEARKFVNEAAATWRSQYVGARASREKGDA